MGYYNIERIFCQKCQGLQELRVNGEESNHWIPKFHRIACNCNKIERKDNMEDRKTVKLGNGDILYIDGICEDDENFYSCSYLSPKTGTEIPYIRVPMRACVESDISGVDFECVPASKRQEKEAEKYKELASLNFGVDYSNINVWVDIKKIGLVRVLKTTKKSVHFVDESGKKRYTAVKNVKGIYNYSPEQELPTAESQKKKAVKSPTKKAASKDKKIASSAAAAAVKSDNFEYIQEVPREEDYRNRQVYIDIDENKKGLKIRRAHGGRVFWDNLETGQYSAISLKKVNSDNNIVVYEYK